MRRRPNILAFIPHDLGDWLGCYGHPSIRSPNLDALAGRGVRFSRCFTPAPECTPSRSCLWTGLQPHQNGLMGLANFGWRLRAPHLARRLADAGYETHLFGFQHEAHGEAASLGYQHVHSQDDYSAAAVCNAAIDVLIDSEEGPAEPWFACLGFSDVHRPWRAPSTFDPPAVEVPPYLPDNPTVRDDLALFAQNVLDMDAAVGRVLEALAARGPAEETLVLFTTDHGAGFPRAKATFYDPGIRVPLLLHWPGHIEGGRVYESLASNLDVTPTLLGLCGCDVPDGLAGRDLRPLLTGRPYRERQEVCGALFYDVAYDPMHYVRTRTHKYIRSFAVTEADAAGADPEVLATFAGGQWVRCDDFDVLSSAAWRSMDVDTSRPPPEELYDLTRDPHEQHNLAGDPTAGGVLEDLRRRLRAMMDRTASPLRTGHVPPPQAQREANRRYRPGGPMYRRKDNEGAC